MNTRRRTKKSSSDAEIKKAIHRKRAAKAEAAKSGDTKMLYHFVKDLSGKATQNPP